MTGKIRIDESNPKTQSIDAVKSLLAWRGRASDPLPEFVELSSNGSRCVLVLSNKRDCYYVTTGVACSCPARSWHPNQPCKHQRKHFSVQQTAKPEAAIKQPNHGAWHGSNGPVAPEETRAAKVSASPLYVDTTPDASPREIAYWSIQEDRALWPAEA